MAKGYWRNWDEIKCHKCEHLIYEKYAKKIKNKYYCPMCYELIECLSKQNEKI